MPYPFPQIALSALSEPQPAISTPINITSSVDLGLDSDAEPNVETVIDSIINLLSQSVIPTATQVSYNSPGTTSKLSGATVGEYLDSITEQFRRKPLCASVQTGASASILPTEGGCFFPLSVKGLSSGQQMSAAIQSVNIADGDEFVVFSIVDEDDTGGASENIPIEIDFGSIGHSRSRTAFGRYMNIDSAGGWMKAVYSLSDNTFYVTQGVGFDGDIFRDVTRATSTMAVDRNDPLTINNVVTGPLTQLQVEIFEYAVDPGGTGTAGELELIVNVAAPVRTITITGAATGSTPTVVDSAGTVTSVTGTAGSFSIPMSEFTGAINVKTTVTDAVGQNVYWDTYL